MKTKTFDKSIEKFIKSLEKPTRAKLVRTIELLKKFHHKLGHPHSKKIFKNIFELRTHGEQKVRIFYTFYKNTIFLLHGFIKKSPKTPKKELKTVLQKLKQLTQV